MSCAFRSAACLSGCLSAFGECHRIPATGTPHESPRSPSLPLHAIPPCKPQYDSLRHKNYAADCHPDMMPDHGRTSSRTPFETMPEDTDGHPRSDTRNDDLGAVGGSHERTRWHDDRGGSTGTGASSAGTDGRASVWLARTPEAGCVAVWAPALDGS